MVLDEALAPVTDKSDGGLGPKDGPSNGGVAVFNTHTWNQDGIVTLSAKESSKGNRVIDENGNSVFSQRLSTGELVFFAKNVPALGSVKPKAANFFPVQRSGRYFCFCASVPN